MQFTRLTHSAFIISSMVTEITELTFHISGMDCASCAANIEKGVAKLAGVQTSQINFTTELLRVQGDVAPDTVVARVRELGYDIVDQQDGVKTAVSHSQTGHFFTYLWQRTDTRLALLGALLILPGLLFNELLPMLGWEHPFLNLTSIAAMAVAGWPIATSALRTLRVNREININLLISASPALLTSKEIILAANDKSDNNFDSSPVASGCISSPSMMWRPRVMNFNFGMMFLPLIF